ADRLNEYGFVTDFGDLAPFGDYLKSAFDHRLINDQVDFHPTSELLAFHFAHCVHRHGPARPLLPRLDAHLSSASRACHSDGR
ncbi:MAG: 6-carboxytetrahydropterin synthase, partial [Pseudonocardiaceae bacterium]